MVFLSFSDNEANKSVVSNKTNESSVIEEKTKAKIEDVWFVKWIIPKLYL